MASGPYSTFTCRLYRDGLQTPWGFRLQGGKDFNQPLTVQRVFTGSPAEGELQRGDVIIKINNTDVGNLNHTQAQDIIKTPAGQIVLNIQRGQTRYSPVKSVQMHQTPQFQQPPPSGFRSVPFEGSGAPKPYTPPTGGIKPGMNFAVDYTGRIGSPVRRPEQTMINRVHDSLNEAIMLQRTGGENEDDYLYETVNDRKRVFSQDTPATKYFIHVKPNVSQDPRYNIDHVTHQVSHDQQRGAPRQARQEVSYGPGNAPGPQQHTSYGQAMPQGDHYNRDFGHQVSHDPQHGLPHRDHQEVSYGHHNDQQADNYDQDRSSYGQPLSEGDHYNRDHGHRDGNEVTPTEHHSPNVNFGTRHLNEDVAYEDLVKPSGVQHYRFDDVQATSHQYHPVKDNVRYYQGKNKNAKPLVHAPGRPNRSGKVWRPPHQTGSERAPEFGWSPTKRIEPGYQPGPPTQERAYSPPRHTPSRPHQPTFATTRLQDDSGGFPAWKGTLHAPGRAPVQSSVPPPRSVQFSAKSPSTMPKSNPGFQPKPTPQQHVNQQHDGPKDGPKVVHLQYNSPIGLYSKQNVDETRQGQTQKLQQYAGALGGNNKDLDYTKSYAWQMIQQESGQGEPQRTTTTSESQFHSKQSRSFRALEDDMEATDF